MMKVNTRPERRAFTLIELLVVIAITAILMTLIVLPMIQSFNLTRMAQGWAAAQDKARNLTEKIAREVNGAVDVRDNSGTRGELDIVVGNPLGGTVVGYDPSRGLSRVSIFNAKIDLIKPFEGDPSLIFGGAFWNPVAKKFDPTLKEPKGQVNYPATAGFTLVRYFVGLRSPLRLSDNGSGYAGYIEPYSGLLQARDSVRDNLYVLYRAEVHPMVWSSTQNKFVVNKQLFVDLGRTGGGMGPLYDDPTFFDPTIAPPAYTLSDPDGTPDPTKAQMVQNWINAATIETEVDHFDMIQPVYDLRTRQVQIVNGAPRIMSLVQFSPAHIGIEPAQGQQGVRLSQENDSPTSLAPDVFVTQYGGLSQAVISFVPGGFVPGQPYEVGLLSGASSGFDVWKYDPAADGTDPNPGSQPAGYKLLDDSFYRDSLRNSIRAGLSRAQLAANDFDIISLRGNWLTDTAMRQNFAGFFGDAMRGRVTTSYGITEIGVCDSASPYMPVPVPDPINNPRNLPGELSWDQANAGAGDPNPVVPKTPFNEYPRVLVNGEMVPDLSAGVFSDAQYGTINREYNKIWFDYPQLRGSIQRFIDLREAANSDGAPSPLNPDPTKGFARAYITPGSDYVFGPDQNPGPNYGNTVRYWRTTHDPGPNQYRINYTDLPEPNYALLGLTPPLPNYSRTDFTTAVIQPRYKAGYIQFDSDPNTPIPGDNPASPKNEAQILVYYRFQFTRPNDSLIVDYDSRQLMTVQMTIRDFPQSDQPNPQSVTLHSTASVRNFLR